MNIAAVMAALEVGDLDRTAKHALVVVCCRCNQYSGAAPVSARRVADDMKVSRPTARRALGRVVDSGYLSVDKGLGKTPIWRLTDRLGVVNPRQGGGKQLLPPPGKQLLPPEDSRYTNKERYAALARLPAGGVTVENPASTWSSDLPPNPWVLDEETGAAALHPALDPANIAECVYCDDHGRLWVDDEPVAQCTHRTPEFTVADILNTPQDP